MEETSDNFLPIVGNPRLVFASLRDRDIPLFFFGQTHEFLNNVVQIQAFKKSSRFNLIICFYI